MRWFILNDLHIPYEDKKAVELVLSIIDSVYKESKIGIILNGDIADFYGVNSHGISPNITESLKEEMESVDNFLFSIAKRYPDARLVFVEGNHCNRLTRYLSQKAPEIYEFLTVDEMCGITANGFEFVPYKAPQQFILPDTNVVIRHEGISNGENACALTLKKGGVSMIFGHTHRVGYATMTLFTGEVIRAINNGWLGNKKHAAFSYVKGFHAWQLSFTEITVMDGQWFEQLCLIQENEGIYKTRFDNHVWAQE